MKFSKKNHYYRDDEHYIWDRMDTWLSKVNKCKCYILDVRTDRYNYNKKIEVNIYFEHKHESKYDFDIQFSYCAYDDFTKKCLTEMFGYSKEKILKLIDEQENKCACFFKGDK